MAWLRKTHGTPGAAQGGLVWNTPDDVVEVEDDLATALLAIPGAGYLSVPEPVAAPEVKDDGKSSEDAKESPAAAKKTTASKAAASKIEVKE
jgi:hypothetical protein